MDLGIKGKRALVTGSSSGIGEGIARMLAREGCFVVVHGRDRARAKAVAADIGAGACAVGDLATDAGADAVAQVAGDIDILVNNAGGAKVTMRTAWTDVTPEDWLETYQANTMSAVRMIHKFLPGMKDRRWGRIINILSVAATQPIAYGPDYGAAKAGLSNLNVSLAKALEDCGVTVNGVSPGTIMTPGVAEWRDAIIAARGWDNMPLAEAEGRIMNDLNIPIPMKRFGHVDDIAHAVCMLAAEGAGYITGANYRVDAGQIQHIN